MASGQLNKLKHKQIENAREPGLYNDGGGLYLRVTPTRTKNWVFRFTKAGKLADMGLGSLDGVSLARAREEARQARDLVKEGKDPREVRKAVRIAQRLEEAKAISFAECSRLYIEAHKAGWKNAKHARQWTNTLATYCGPINDQPAPKVDTGLVLRCLEPIWSKKPETASRVRSRIEAVLDWARVRGYRTGDNPARWRGHLDKLLPRLSKKQRVKHHRALPYARIHDFVTDLRKQEGNAAKCAELTLLCVARTNESTAAKPAEFDTDKALWIVPKERMGKTKREHRVPLSPRALEIVKEAIRDATKAGREYLFPGDKPRSHLSNGAMLALLDRMEWRDRTTIHGLRSSFRDWAAECTAVPFEVVEMALAHTVGNEAAQAYLRADLFEKRRRLLRDWEKFCSTAPAKGKVVTIRKVVA